MARPTGCYRFRSGTHEETSDGAQVRDRENKAGELVAKFKHNGEVIFWTEGYTCEAAARKALESIQKNGPGAPTEEVE